MDKIAIHGTIGSFHHNVALALFGEEATFVTSSSFSETISLVEQGKVETGIIAIENSLAGTLLENYRLLRNAYVEIVGEHYLKIAHYLLALPGQKQEQINRVISHDMALKQCKNFLDQMGVHDRSTFSDTASACAHISQNQLTETAAIGSIEAAQHYNLNIIAANIQNTPNNYTRFLLLKRPGTNGFNMNNNKATIVFSVEDEPGKLAQILQFLTKRKVNLTKIESVPHLSRLGQFDMITDLELPKGEQLRSILPELTQLASEIKLLGTYKQAEKPWKKEAI